MRTLPTFRSVPDNIEGKLLTFCKGNFQTLCDHLEHYECLLQASFNPTRNNPIHF
jgi:hypothetical protein